MFHDPDHDRARDRDRDPDHDHDHDPDRDHDHDRGPGRDNAVLYPALRIAAFISAPVEFWRFSPRRSAHRDRL